jgi:hypothetical protein
MLEKVCSMTQILQEVKRKKPERAKRRPMPTVVMKNLTFVL